MKKSELRTLIREEIQKINESFNKEYDTYMIKTFTNGGWKTLGSESLKTNPTDKEREKILKQLQKKYKLSKEEVDFLNISNFNDVWQ